MYRIFLDITEYFNPQSLQWYSEVYRTKLKLFNTFFKALQRLTVSQKHGTPQHLTLITEQIPCTSTFLCCFPI